MECTRCDTGRAARRGVSTRGRLLAVGRARIVRVATRAPAIQHDTVRTRRRRYPPRAPLRGPVADHKHSRSAEPWSHAISHGDAAPPPTSLAALIFCVSCEGGQRVWEALAAAAHLVSHGERRHAHAAMCAGHGALCAGDAASRGRGQVHAGAQRRCGGSHRDVLQRATRDSTHPSRHTQRKCKFPHRIDASASPTQLTAPP